ncbi:MAG: arginase family protein [Mangrovibacterium sp.]
MNIEDFVIPIDFGSDPYASLAAKKYSLAGLLRHNQQSVSINEADVALLSIGGDVNGDAIREQLYALNRIDATAKIIDLGTLIKGYTTADLQIALQEVSSFCVSHRLLLVLLSASRNQESAILKSYGKYDFNMLRVDSRFRLSLSGEASEDQCCMRTALQNFKNIFSLSYVGFQNYFVDNEEQTYLESQGTSLFRLGNVRDDIRQVEPLFRDAHYVSFDVESIRTTDFPAQYVANANGIRAEEACALAKYAGAGTDLRTFALYGMHAAHDDRNRSASLAAQLLWHVLEAYLGGVSEDPHIHTDSFEEYLVRFPDLNEAFVFYKSKLTERWWLKLNDRRTDEDLFIPCLEKDYKKALQLDLPEVWLKYIRKFK